MNRLQKLAIVAPTPIVGGSAITLPVIQNILTSVAQFLIVASMVIAVIVIVYGGIRWMMASDPAEAKKIVWNGIVGAAIVLAVGIILQTIGYVITYRG